MTPRGAQGLERTEVMIYKVCLAVVIVRRRKLLSSNNIYNLHIVSCVTGLRVEVNELEGQYGGNVIHGLLWIDRDW